MGLKLVLQLYRLINYQVSSAFCGKCFKAFLLSSNTLLLVESSIAELEQGLKMFLAKWVIKIPYFHLYFCNESENVTLIQ